MCIYSRQQCTPHVFEESTNNANIRIYGPTVIIIIYSGQNYTFVNARHKLNRWLQTQQELRNVVGFSHDALFISISVKFT